MKTIEKIIEIEQSIINDAAFGKLLTYDFTKTKQYGRKIIESLNKKYFKELEILGGKIKLIYREDQQYQRSWSVSDYFDDLQRLLIDLSCLQQRKISMGNFKKAHTYTTECNVFVGIDNIGDGLYDRIYFLQQFKNKLKNNLKPIDTPFDCKIFDESNKRWENHLFVKLSKILPVNTVEHIKKIRSNQPNYLNSILYKKNYNEIEIIKKFSN